MAKTLNQRYEELNAEIERLTDLSDVSNRAKNKAWAVCARWQGIAESHEFERRKCQMAIREVAAKREALVTRLMKGKASKWLPPERAPVAYFEEA